MRIIVYENFDNAYDIMGYLNVNRIRGHLSTNFEYDEKFLKKKKIIFNRVSLY